MSAPLLLACGLRSSPENSGLCVSRDDPGYEDSSEGETGGEAVTGSCENPMDLAWLQNTRVHGQLGDCGDLEGWCGGNGGEDVYKLGPVSNPIDAVFEFDPLGTEIDPIFRIISHPIGSQESLCDQITQEMVCAPIVKDDPRFTTFVSPDYAYYAVVDSHAGNAGSYSFSFNFGLAAVGDTCMKNIVGDPASPTILSPGAEPILLQGQLSGKQGHFTSNCVAPGDEDIYPITSTSYGTISAQVLSWTGSMPPVLAFSHGCSGNHLAACKTFESFGDKEFLEFEMDDPGSIYLIVDQSGNNGGDYEIQLSFD